MLEHGVDPKKREERRESIPNTVHPSIGSGLVPCKPEESRMISPPRSLYAVVVPLALVASSAHAASIWATWVRNSDTSATGSFVDGRSVSFSGNVDGIDESAENGTVDPVIPGETSGGNPPGVAALTGVPHPTLIDPGAFIMAMDLTNLPIDDATTFALSDMFDYARYRLELLDSNFMALPLGAVVVTNYNLAFHSPSTAVADLDVALDTTTGALRVGFVHDADPLGSYRHSGIVTFTKLPAETRFIRLTSDSPNKQDSEGVHFYIGGSVPEAGAAALELVSVVTLGTLVRKRRTR